MLQMTQNRVTVTWRPRRRWCENRRLKIESERVELPTVRLGGGDSNFKPSLMFDVTKLRRVSLMSKGDRRDPKKSRIQSEQFSPARMLLFVAG